MNVKIFIMTHKRFQQPEDDIYIPLHVGRAASQDLGYLGDDRGENISALNSYYGELTGLYWIWKHETEADLVGICHYRRYFLNDSGGFMSQQEYEDMLAGCDVVTSEFVFSGSSNWDTYASAHNAADMQAVGEAVKKLFPNDYKAFCDVLEGSKCCYGNLMVTTLEKYREYCDWLFTILEEAGKHIDVAGYDSYHKRVYGFLSEVLLYVWINARRYRVKEGKIGITSEKAETAEFKQEIEQLIGQEDIASAKEYYYSYLEQRPDIRLGQSDICGDIPVIEKLLFIMYEENRKHETGLLKLSGSLAVLIGHYKNTYQIIAQNGKDARKSGKTYFDSFPVSDSAFRMIEQDVKGELSIFRYLNEGCQSCKIIVIVLVSGYVDTFPGCIGNLVHQTMHDIRILFVSETTDESVRLLNDCQIQYPKKVQVLTPKMWMKEMQEMDSEYVLFVRAEDLPDIGICEKLYTRAAQTGGTFVRGKYVDVQNGCIAFLSIPWGMLIKRGVWDEYSMQIEYADGLESICSMLEQLLPPALPAEGIEEVVYKYCG